MAVSETSKRTTVCFDPETHRVLRIKAAESGRSVSELVNEAVKESLAADAQDLAVFDGRARERSLRFEDVVKRLRRRGSI
jgi:plasmid stability protein